MNLPFPILFWSLLSLLLFVVGWLAASAWVDRWLRRPSLVESLCAGFVLWHAVIAQTAITLVILHFFRVWLFLAVPILAAGVLFYLGDAIAYACRLGRRIGQILSSGWQSLGMLAALGTVAVCGWFAWAYPVESWDTQQYHRPMSALLLQEGRLSALPSAHLAVSVYPKNGEIAAAWVLCFARWDAPLRVLPSLNLFVLIMAAYGLLRRFRVPVFDSALLANSAIAAPVVFQAAMIHTGYIDINVTTAMFVGLLLAVGIMSDRDQSWRRGILAFLAAAFLVGLKGNGAVPGLAVALVAGIALFRVRISWRQRLLVTFAGLLMALTLSSYWLFSNLARYNNPVFPFRITVLGRTWFEGPDTFFKYENGQLSSELQVMGGWARFWEITGTTDIGSVFWTDRIGGWGWHFFFLAQYGFVVFLILVVIQRQWTLLLVCGACLAVVFLSPHPWLARQSLCLIVAAPLPIAALYHWRKTSRFAPIVAEIWFLSAIFTSVSSMQAAYFRAGANVMEDIARSHGRQYLIPHDGFRTFGEIHVDRDMYAWVGNNVRKGTLLGYDLAEPGFQGLLFRPDYRNRVRRLERNIPLGEFDYLVLRRSRMDRYSVEPAEWKISFENAEYVILERLTSGASKPEGSPSQNEGS